MVTDFKKKQKGGSPGNKVVFQIAGLLFVIIIVVLFFANYKIYQRKKELTAEINNYKNQIAAIQKNNQTLREEIANSNSKDYIEKIAYEQLGEQKPGEKEIIFVAPPKKAEAIPQQENFWIKCLNWIKSKF